MTARKDNSPSVATFADHEVITPANPLYKAIAQAPAEDDDPVARAEAALALLSTEFAEWMQSECERLAKLSRAAVAEAFARSNGYGMSLGWDNIRDNTGPWPSAVRGDTSKSSPIPIRQLHLFSQPPVYPGRVALTSNQSGGQRAPHFSRSCPCSPPR